MARLVSVVHHETPNPYPVVSRLRDRNSAASGAAISMDQVCHCRFLNLTRTFSRVLLQLFKQQPSLRRSGGFFQGCGSFGASTYPLRAPLSVVSRPLSTQRAVGARLCSHCLFCSVFQSLESPVHGDTQRGKSGYDLTFESRPWLPLSLAAPLLPL